MVKFVIYGSGPVFNGTTKENYDRRIMDANKVKKFDTLNGFESKEDVKQCLINWKWYEPNEIGIL